MCHIQVLIPNENVLIGLHNIGVQKPLSIPPAAKWAHQCSTLTTSTHCSQHLISKGQSISHLYKQTSLQGHQMCLTKILLDLLMWLSTWNFAQKFTAAICDKVEDSNSQLIKSTFFFSWFFCVELLDLGSPILGNKKVDITFHKHRIRLKVECEKWQPLKYLNLSLHYNLSFKTLAMGARIVYHFAWLWVLMCMAVADQSKSSHSLTCPS
jgi:hypothetical protein